MYGNDELRMAIVGVLDITARRQFTSSSERRKKPGSALLLTPVEKESGRSITVIPALIARTSSSLPRRHIMSL